MRALVQGAEIVRVELAAAARGREPIAGRSERK